MNSMLKIGILLSLSDMASAGLAQFGNSLEQQAKKGETAFKRLGTAMQQQSTKMIAMGTGASMFGYGLANVLEKPIEAFTRLDDATTDLEVAMMDSTGKIGDGFKEILDIAKQLGNVLPGETSDFVKVAQALMEQGMSAKAVQEGGLVAASHLSVVLKQSGYEAATMVAKLKEAYGMSDKELGYAADQVQRARFAFGMKPEDIAAANSYQSAQLNILGIKGAENLRKMLALQGNTAPYLVYAYARIKSIFRKAEGRIQNAEIKLVAPEELALAKHLLNFGITLEAVGEEFRPNYLCNYLFELAGKFTSFYENCPVLKADDAATRNSRLALCDLTARVLQQGLATLGIETVEQM